MKRILFPPKVKDTKKVIEFLEFCCAKGGYATHYQFLKRMKEAQTAAWGIFSFGCVALLSSDFPSEINLKVLPSLVLIGIGTYVISYAKRCNTIMDAFHMDHLEDLNETALDKFIRESTTNRSHEADPVDGGQ